MKPEMTKESYDLGSCICGVNYVEHALFANLDDTGDAANDSKGRGPRAQDTNCDCEQRSICHGA